MPLSRFRVLERLPGAAQPAVFKITFACDCGGEHDGLVTHDELDWAPLAGSGCGLPQPDDRAASSRPRSICSTSPRGGSSPVSWPWSFFCYPEERPRPVTPSAFRRPRGAAGRGSASRSSARRARTRPSTSSAASTSTCPFYNDRRVGVVEHIFARDHELALAAFRDELLSGVFDARRRDLAA